MNRLLQRIGILIAILACASATGFGQIYVDADATGANNGSSWEDAYQSLQDALGVALDGDEIWVAAGTYSPGADTLSTFQLVEGVNVYGGFDGTESAVDERDPSANVTILSGDVNDDDIAGDFDANRGDNNFHVVYADSTITNATMLDGFTISGGNARRIASLQIPMRTGGGGILTSGSPIIANCIITDNAAGLGGGLYNWELDASRIKVMDCQIIRNLALFGGGIFSDFNSGGLYRNTSVSENSSINSGGGHYKSLTRDTFINCQINENQILDTASGGGVVSASFSESVYINCEFIGNQSTFNGGAFNCPDTSEQKLLMINCEISENSAFQNGGAFTFRQGTYKLSNCNITSNLGIFGGAGISFDSDTVSFDSCNFEANQALSGGGGFYGLGNTIVMLSNSSFNQNQGSIGGGYYNHDAISYITNCDFTENEIEEPNPMFAAFGGAIFIRSGNATITDCLFEENVSNDNGGALSSLSGGHTLTNCIFSSNEAITGDGGAVYNIAASPSFTDCTFNNNSADWGGAYAETGGVSTFTNCMFDGNSAVNGGGACITAFNGQTNVTGSVIESNEADFSGGGWYIQESDTFSSTRATFINTRFTLNSNRGASPNGMGFLVNGSADVIVDSCVFESNSPTNTSNENAGGGAISYFGDSLSLGSLEITQSSFIGNIARFQGGALELSNVNSQIINSIFFNNISNIGGAIINNGSFPAGSSMELVNNTFVLNEADSATDIAQWENPDNGLATATVQNNIFVQGQGDGGVYVSQGTTTPELISNGGNLIRDMSFGSSAIASDVQNENDAGFKDVSVLNLRLDSAANAEDIGINQGAPTVDITDSIRLISDANARVDAGAYERHKPVAVKDYITDFALDMNPTVTNENVTINYDSKEMGDIQVLMFDYHGKVVYQSEDEKRAPTYRRTYNVGHLPSGTYFVRVLTGERIGGGKFVVAQ